MTIMCIQGLASSGLPVRLTGLSGVSHVGLLELGVPGSSESFGTVCGLNSEASDVVCRQLGYDFGSVASASCDNYGLHNVCGAPGAPVAVKSLSCTGDELSVFECEGQHADETCASHKLDSVVYCGRNDAGRFFSEGAARLLNAFSAPAVDGRGRLETFVDGTWSPVCRVAFGSSSAAVACKSIGYAGVAAEATLPCKSVAGQGNLWERGDDVICAPEASNRV